MSLVFSMAVLVFINGSGRFSMAGRSGRFDQFGDNTIDKKH